ncbi:MAG TPA: hypothetical protein VLL25_02575 [Acidimicrobiales bacterium]|nr:hypothetical protein [Acidimicrobiales bacterium]
MPVDGDKGDVLAEEGSGHGMPKLVNQRPQRGSETERRCGQCKGPKGEADQENFEHGRSSALALAGTQGGRRHVRRR